MRKLKSTITYKVPNGLYCNHNLHGIKPRCRFCTEFKKGLFVCVLHNQTLVVDQAVLILKCKDCLNAPLFSTQHIVEEFSREETSAPMVPVRDIVRGAVTEYKKVYKDLLNQGYPHNIIEKIATDIVVKEDKK